LLKKFKNKKIILVVNKSESSNRDDKIYYGLGFGKPYYISAEHKIGTGDLLDAVINTKTSIAKAKIDKNFSFCIIGRPNVGKSTLLNTIVQENRSIVSPIAHTTRDAIDADFKYNGEKFTIVDTAGIRRKGKIGDEIELFAIMRTQQAIDRSNLILFVIDGSESFNEQDEVIGGLAYKANIPTIIVVNKWDNVKNKDQSSMRKMEVDIRTRFKYLAWAPIVFISAKENERVATIFKTIELVREQLKIKVTTSALNNVLARAQISNPPPRIQGDRIDIKYGTQVKSSIPTFTLFTNDPKHLHFAYMRYIENTIRESFGINIVPITVYYKDKNARIRTEK
jgi:GTP-binding protein